MTNSRASGTYSAPSVPEENTAHAIEVKKYQKRIADLETRIHDLTILGTMVRGCGQMASWDAVIGVKYLSSKCGRLICKYAYAISGHASDSWGSIPQCSGEYCYLSKKRVEKFLGQNT